MNTSDSNAASKPQRSGFASMVRFANNGVQLFGPDRKSDSRGEQARAKRKPFSRFDDQAPPPGNRLAAPRGGRSGFTSVIEGFRLFGPKRLRDRATGPTALAVMLNPHQFSAALENADLLPVRLFARSVGPAIHPYYAGGVVYHDFSGMTVAPGRLVIDWKHGDAIGYLDSYQLVQGVGLYLNGALELNGENGELARSVASQLSEGVSLESSIATGGKETVEEVEEFSAGNVNGLTARGPCAIVRKWTLIGVAVCPYGADSATTAELIDA